MKHFYLIDERFAMFSGREQSIQLGWLLQELLTRMDGADDDFEMTVKILVQLPLIS